MYSTSTVAPVLGCGPHQQNDETPKKCHPIRTLWEVERRTHKSPVGLNLCLRLLLAEIQIWGLKTSQKKMPNHWGVPPFGRSIQPCPPGSKKRRFPVRGKWRLECSWQVELKASINKNKLVWVGFLASSYFDIPNLPASVIKKCVKLHLVTFLIGTVPQFVETKMHNTWSTTYLSKAFRRTKKSCLVLVQFLRIVLKQPWSKPLTMEQSH